MNKLNKLLNVSIFSKVIFYIILVLSGLLWGLGQYPDYCFIRFFGLIPFLFVVFYRKHFLIETLIFGLTAYLVNFYFIFFTFYESGKLPIAFSIVIVFSLCFYYGLQYPLITFIYKKFTLFNKKILFFSFPFVFVFVDSLFPKLFQHTISDGLISFRQFIQIIDITGMTGVTLVIMFFNLGLYKIIKRHMSGKRFKIITLWFLIPFLAVLLYGFIRLDSLEKDIKMAKTTKAAMIQGNVTGKQKLDSSYFQVTIDRYNKLMDLSQKDESSDIIIWPESVFNRAYGGNPDFFTTNIHNDYKVMLLGIVVWVNDKITNSIILLNNRKKVAQYDKKHLLMMGEYVPLEKYLPFLRKLTPFSYNITPGSSNSILKINDSVKASVSICFEDIFPDEIRKNNNQGSNIMINITNDSWYGDTIGPIHHSILARLRAIENRRSLFRCTATGLTTASDFTGRVVAKGSMFTEEIVKSPLPLYEKRSIYSYIGEIFTYISIFIVILIVLTLFTCKFIKFK